MKYLMTLGGKAGPETRDEMVRAVRAFSEIYGTEAAAMTVMPGALATILPWFREERGGVEDPSFSLEKTLSGGMAVGVLGVRLSLGPAYTLSA